MLESFIAASVANVSWKTLPGRRHGGILDELEWLEPAPKPSAIGVALSKDT